MLIVNINGPINSGKTTTSKLLIKELDNALFIEVDDLLSDDEQNKLGLSMEDGWSERTKRLNSIVCREKLNKNYEIIIFAYPITANLYEEWKKWEDDGTRFINITLSPRLDICVQNRGNRILDKWEVARIKQMYLENYHCPNFSDLIIDNSEQTPEQTKNNILSFLRSIIK